MSIRTDYFEWREKVVKLIVDRNEILNKMCQISTDPAHTTPEQDSQLREYAKQLSDITSAYLKLQKLNY